MKRRGILNDALSGHLARLGHTDTVVVADCGLPRPAGVPVVDLALTFGVPSFAEVVDALATEIVVESAAVARETAENNPAARDLLLGHFGEPRWLTHQELKEESAHAALFVRTGEASPYANAILTCGVPF
ncbi:D-ribose pyranase [Georgenia sp. TF02-10]|uniref:D-ribose pyranase n=1 Tax=Georgenia sp. TF02-10 TaxID=2917725 RepID=UPI001FA6ADFE|nr:D-ribose pyranase [Georgenia sp. TF02-10]UNX54231.1 D-ribose pyranase [Georgenia sp. TF02-10]